MIRFDHLRIPVTDLARARSWYVDTLGLKVEFDVPDRQTVALQDSGGFTIFLQEIAPGFKGVAGVGLEGGRVVIREK